jgi:anti-sigma regulatory factor (Ser/Thr protein kinase)
MRDRIVPVCLALKLALDCAERQHMTLELARQFPLTPTAPREARASLEGLRLALSPPAMETVRLIVSELIANSVVHSGMKAGEPIHMRVMLSRSSVRIEVTDRGSAQPAIGIDETDHLPEEHPGMYLVAQLADRWGVEIHDLRTMWAELDPHRNNRTNIPPERFAVRE